jgi:type IV secretory pathway ATPase VirB11/archaellum biosynthesis ATPase
LPLATPVSPTGKVAAQRCADNPNQNKERTMNKDTAMKTRPTHNAFVVRKYKANGQHRSEYSPIVAAWLHGDGDGFDIVLTAFPVNGRVTLRKVKPKPEEA